MRQIILFGFLLQSMLVLSSCNEPYHRLTSLSGNGEFFSVQNTLHHHNEVLLYGADGRLLQTIIYPNQIVGTNLTRGKLFIFESGGSPDDAKFDSQSFRYTSTIHECDISEEPFEVSCKPKLDVRGGLACPFFLEEQMYLFVAECRNTKADWKFCNPKLAKLMEKDFIDYLKGPNYWPSDCPLIYGGRAHHATAGLVQKYQNRRNRASEIKIVDQNFEIVPDLDEIEDQRIQWRHIPDLNLRLVSDGSAWTHKCIMFDENACIPDENYIGISINELGVYEAKMVPGTKERVVINQLISFESE